MFRVYQCTLVQDRRTGKISAATPRPILNHSADTQSSPPAASGGGATSGVTDCFRRPPLAAKVCGDLYFAPVTGAKEATGATDAVWSTQLHHTALVLEGNHSYRAILQIEVGKACFYTYFECQIEDVGNMAFCLCLC